MLPLFECNPLITALIYQPLFIIRSNDPSGFFFCFCSGEMTFWQQIFCLHTNYFLSLTAGFYSESPTDRIRNKKKQRVAEFPADNQSLNGPSNSIRSGAAPGPSAAPQRGFGNRLGWGGDLPGIKCVFFLLFCPQILCEQVCGVLQGVQHPPLIALTCWRLQEHEGQIGFCSGSLWGDMQRLINEGTLTGSGWNRHAQNMSYLSPGWREFTQHTKYWHVL